MKANAQSIIKIFEKRKESIANEPMPLEEDRLHSALSSFFISNFSLLYMLDLQSNEVIYINDKTATANKSESYSTLDQFYTSIHQDDLNHIRKCEEIIRYFTLNVIDEGEIPYYKSSYQFRRKDKNGDYRNMLCQSFVLAVKNGKLCYLLSYESETEQMTFSNDYKLSFIDLRGQKSYYEITDIADLKNPKRVSEVLTTREIEILRLLSEGESSKVIADTLHISYDTVRTHRNNILKKTKMKTLTQVISRLIKKGIL